MQGVGMRISALADAAGLPVATVKFYLREGLLHSGVATSATQANYDESHLRRLRLVRALIGSVGLSVQQARTVLDLVDHPGDDLYSTLGRAVGALPPAAAAPGDDSDPYPRARAALAALGQVYDPDLERMPQEPHAAVEYTVLGTALYEPVILALRRLAHQDGAVRRLRGKR